jgi:hypothetical protein
MGQILCTDENKTKMIPIETIPGMGGRDKGKWWKRVNSIMIYLIYCKNFCKCHNVIPSNTIIKKKQKND